MKKVKKKYRENKNRSKRIAPAMLQKWKVGRLLPCAQLRQVHV